MLCRNCNKIIKNLTWYRPKGAEFCTCNSDYPNLYQFSTMSIGQPRIYPWTNPDKCFNRRDSNSIRCCLRNYIKKHGGQFWIRRHLAGMQVGRVA